MTRKPNHFEATLAFSSTMEGVCSAQVQAQNEHSHEQGLKDHPNIWFHHVEYIAADEIGAETVTYVSNIYKYYIAYQLIMEARAAREKAAEKIKSQSK